LHETNNGGAGSPANPFVITRTFTATDGVGNSSSAVQTITVADGTAPTITAQPNASYQCVSEVPAANASQASASDNCAAPSVTVIDTNNGGAGSAASPLIITRTFRATDAAGNSSIAAQTITVIDSTPPTLSVPGANPLVVECHSTFVDPGAIAGDACDASVPVTVSGLVNVNVPGDYLLTYSATDHAGNTRTATRVVRVVDTIQPSITFNNLTIFFNNLTIVFGNNTVTVNGQSYPFNGVSFTHSNITFSFNGENITITTNGNAVTYPLNGKTLTLWTPTRQYQTVKVADLIASAGDSCNTDLSRNAVVISKVTSDEADNAAGNGDGNTVNDIVINPDCKSVQLRAERADNGNGRVYTITFSVRDSAGNVKTVTSKINVFRNLSPVVDSGAQYTVTSSCP
jgi:large repetitive protein